MVSELNLYPDDNPKVRKKGRRKPRPKHLPPYRPDAVNPENEALAKKQLQTGPASTAAFGAPKGAGNALLFHQMKTAPLKPAEPKRDDDDDDDAP